MKFMSALNDGVFGAGTNAIILSLLMRDQQILLCSYMFTMGCLISLQYVSKLIPKEEQQDGENQKP